MAVLRNISKCSHTTCMLRLFNVSRLALNPNLIFEIDSNCVLFLILDSYSLKLIKHYAKKFTLIQ
jgi:hypothetical protein